MIDVGDAAPDAGFEIESGKAARASDWLGRKLVIYFYPKDDTSGCTKEAQEFTALAGEFASADTAVVGISRDTIASHAKFLQKYQLGVQLGADPDGQACEAFGVWVEKSMYGKKYMGIERATFLIGRDGRVAQLWRKVKVPGHAAAVLEAARAIA